MVANYFALLDIKQQYDIDLVFLKKQYLKLQAKYHPDSAAAHLSIKEAIDMSMSINYAYKILKDDYLRAEYLLKLKGIEFDDKTLKNRLSINELEQIINQLEEIQETQDLKLLRKIEKLKLKEKEAIISSLVKCFSQNKLDQALDLTIRLKYLTNLVKNIKLKIKNADS